MREIEFIEQELEKGGGRIPVDFSGADPVPEAYTENPASDYFERTGTHYIAEKLGITHFYKADPLLEIKVQEVDRYFRDSIKEFGMRDSITSYNALLDQAVEQFGSLEEMIRSGNAMKVIDHLFSKISLTNKKSTETYIKDAKTHQLEEKVARFENAIKQMVKSLQTALR